MTDWTRPAQVDDVTVAFPAGIAHLQPPWAVIPAEFREGSGTWVDFQQRWFYRGLPKTVEFHCREGVDGNTAVRHLAVLQGSFEFKHEHKEAAVAWLASLWFIRVVVDAGESYGEAP